ncbi:PREDICTED: cytochrome P450 705A5-like [Camelina sativa]|uniref:Cytochrome P450 705A5-like n=1 Tax=Camelina sativa TaxID=90675 RepID=A0ABM0YZW9_CAMSA|nr:PREDICTED: cytochrome P450 705A5-like [Camelina sativa]
MIILDFQCCFIFISLCSIFSFLCYSLFFKKPSGSIRGCDLPPSLPSLPIIGHLHLLLSTLPHKSLQKLSFKYGSLISLRIFNIPVVLVSSASVAYEIFRTHDVNISFRGSPPIDDSLFVGSWSFIFSPYGDHWKFMKKLMVTKLLGSQALERSRVVRADELHRFYVSLLDKAGKKETIDIVKETMRLSNNIICKMIVGRSCSEENGEAEKARSLASESIALVNKIVLGSMLRPPFKKLLTSLFRKEVMVLSSRFDELLERILREYEEKLDGHQGTELMDALLEAYQDENAEYKITRNHIKSFVADLLFAGTDTTAQTTQWTMAEIINNPNILERLREEIDTVVGKTRLIQERDLPKLPYLQAVVKEVLRLHPPGSFFARVPQEGCRIGEFYVPEETSLIVNVYAVMRDPDFWEDPNEFKPERFLTSSRSGKEDERREKALKYIPFGGGRRGCPGENLAYIILGSVVGMMVQGFEWRIKGDKVDLEESIKGLTLTMAHPPKFTPIARTLNPLTSNLPNHNL